MGSSTCDIWLEMILICQSGDEFFFQSDNLYDTCHSTETRDLCLMELPCKCGLNVNCYKSKVAQNEKKKTICTLYYLGF